MAVSINPGPVIIQGGSGGGVASNVTVDNPTADPETGLAKESTLAALTERDTFPLPAEQLTALTPFEHVSVDDAGGSLTVDGTVAATQSGSWTVTANVGTGTQPVSGSVSVSNFPATQSVSGTVSVGNFPGTQAVSGTVAVSNLPATQAVSGTVAVSTPSDPSPATLAVTATGAAAAAVTATLPAVAGQYHYISAIQILAYATAAKTGGATPVVVTTTNLPGTPAFTFPSAMAIGTATEQRFEFDVPLRSSAVNTATTIVAPVNATAIWRINVFYRTGA